MTSPQHISTDILLDASIDTLHERACNIAEGIQAEFGNTPCIYGIDNGIAVVWLECTWESHAEREFHAALMARAIRRFDAQQYTQISEASFTRMRTDQDGQDREIGRDDCFFVLTHSRDGKIRFSRWTVQNGMPGERQNLDDAHHLTGLVANLFAAPIGECEDGT